MSRKIGCECLKSKWIGQRAAKTLKLQIFYIKFLTIRATDIDNSRIAKCAGEKYGCKTAGGFIWKFVED